MAKAKGKNKGVAVFIAIGMPESKLLKNLKRRKNGKSKKK
tara:strand:+ start:277 stop:396 length:120 start_codon:yes stop_codon:yes gene_type:complete